MGLGTLAARLLPSAAAARLNPAALGLLGLASLSTLGNAANFVVPLAWLSLPLLLAGWALAARYVRSRPRDAILADTLAIGVVALGETWATRFSFPVFDSYQYHLPSSVWAAREIYPVGYAHLNPFLGFNSGWEVVGALVGGVGLGLDAHYTADAIAIGLCLSFFVLTARDARADAGAHALVALAVLVALNFPASGGANATDSIVLVYGLFALFHLVRYAAERDAGDAVLATAGAAVALAAKLSALPLLAGTALVFLHQWWRHGAEAMDRARAGKLAGLAIAILAPCLARGFFATGCLAFPLRASCFPSLPWALPLAEADELHLDIRRAAGSCFLEPGARAVVRCLRESWAPAFLESREGGLLVGALLVAAAAAVLFRARRRLSPGRARPVVPALLTAAGGLAFWFVSAPAPRFGMTFLAGASILVLLAAVLAAGLEGAIVRRRRTLLLVLVLLCTKRLVVLELAAEPSARAFPKVAPRRAIAQVSANGVPYVTSDVHGCADLAPPCAYDPRPDLVIERGFLGRYSFRRPR